MHKLIIISLVNYKTFTLIVFYNSQIFFQTAIQKKLNIKFFVEVDPNIRIVPDIQRKGH